MSATCHAPRPSPDDADHRALLLVQRWTAPSGAVGELVVELHGAHCHLWWLWDEEWEAGMAGGDEDWAHVLDAVWPVVRDVVDAVRCCLPLDVASRDSLDLRAAP
ncbi:MAG TPA: hypothetical protein VMR23_14680 [Candidatus Limnocylindria bacterium]|nr:hypothetical protein [Candidatus Limnocylindria bacterium]